MDDFEASLPKHMRATENTVRKRSIKKERKMAKVVVGKTTINSGATLGENDINSKTLSIEHKYTDKQQYAVKLADLLKLEKRTPAGKLPVFVIEFSDTQKFAIINFDDFINLKQ